MFFGLRRMFFCKDGDGDGGGGGGGGGGGAAAPDEAKLTAARAAAKEAGTHIVHDWREAIPKEFATDKSLADIKDLPGVFKSYISAQKLIGSDKVAIPKEDDAEGWNQFFAKLGRPEAPEKYEFDPVDGAPEGFSMDPEFEKAFRAEAHKLGLNKKQAAAMWGSLVQRAASNYKGALESSTTRLTQEGETLKKEWGQAYPEKLKLAQRAVDAIEKTGVKGLNDWLKKSGAGREPIVMRLFALVGEQAGEEKLGPGNTRQNFTPREAEAQANRIMEDKGHPDFEAYWTKKHPRHSDVVKKVQGLLAQTGA
jgi:hypothetical protein